LTLALGGALGGIFNVFVVPFILPLALEFALFLLITLLPNFKDDMARLKLPNLKKLHNLIFGLMGLTIILLACSSFSVDMTRAVTPVVLVVALMLATMLPSVLAIGSIAIIVVSIACGPLPLEMQRDFFGVKRVLDRTLEDGLVYRTLLNGTTSHGMQQRTPTVSTAPLLYYAKGGGLQDLMALMKPKHMGVVGLGMGVVACVPGKTAQTRFFEIDPGVVELAKHYFTFLQECPTDIVVGDARMTLASDNHIYDVVMLDAFSSDAIPVHLLTQEMFKVYAAHLDPHGALILHISNRYLNLSHVVAGAAQQLGWHGAIKYAIPQEGVVTLTPNEYAVLSPDENVIKKLLDVDGWKPIEDTSPLFWTDDHISIVPILNFGIGR
jgi:hypothetical protein